MCSVLLAEHGCHSGINSNKVDETFVHVIELKF